MNTGDKSMKDRFKFRAWNTTTKMMKEVSQLNFSEEQVGNCAYDNNKCTIHLCWQPSMIVMQCTSLRDRNGKLIYEGDIIRQPDDCIGFIVWQGVSYWVESPGSHAKDLEHSPYYESVEVIGNIYENPELLEEKCNSI